MRDSACDDNVLLATIFMSEKAMMQYWPRMRHLMRAMSPFGVRFAVVEVRDEYFTRFRDCDVPLWHDLANPRNAWCTKDADVMIAKLAFGCGDHFHKIPSEWPATYLAAVHGVSSLSWTLSDLLPGRDARPAWKGGVALRLAKGRERPPDAATDPPTLRCAHTVCRWQLTACAPLPARACRHGGPRRPRPRRCTPPEHNGSKHVRLHAAPVRLRFHQLAVRRDAEGGESGAAPRPRAARAADGIVARAAVSTAVEVQCARPRGAKRAKALIRPQRLPKRPCVSNCVTVCVSDLSDAKIPRLGLLAGSLCGAHVQHPHIHIY